MTASPDFRAAAARDLADVQALLESTGLPFEDLDENAMQDFIVLHGARGLLLATGGIEVHGADALLRSVAVADAARGGGLGRTITAMLEDHARSSGVRTLYLLTTTAADFFPRLGYRVSERHDVPALIAQSAEFASLCPASAVCMKKNLE